MCARSPDLPPELSSPSKVAAASHCRGAPYYSCLLSAPDSGRQAGRPQAADEVLAHPGLVPGCYLHPPPSAERGGDGRLADGEELGGKVEDAEFPSRLRARLPKPMPMPGPPNTNLRFNSRHLWLSIPAEETETQVICLRSHSEEGIGVKNQVSSTADQWVRFRL